MKKFREKLAEAFALSTLLLMVVAGAVGAVFAMKGCAKSTGAIVLFGDVVGCALGGALVGVVAWFGLLVLWSGRNRG